MSQTKTAKHTPGPWFVEEQRIIGDTDNEPRIIALLEDDGDGAETSEGFVPSEEFVANACLIAAAPDLLAALRLAAHALKDYEEPAILRAALTAIAKAEDREATKRLRKAGELLGIQVIDHLIITDTEYYSFREGGLL